MTARDPFDGIVPFVAVAEAKSFLKAAAKLGVTPSAISKSIARLERDVGVRLLHRSARSVSATSEGEAFLATCRDVVSRMESARAALDEARKTPRGRLRVSVPTVLGARIVAGLPRLLAAHAGLEIDVVTTDRFVQLVDERIDVAIRVGALDDSANHARRLRTTHLVTVASRAYLARAGTPRTPTALVGHSCLAFVLPSGTAQPWFFRRGARRWRIAVDGPFRMNHGEELLAAAIAGLGIAQAPDVMVDEALVKGHLFRILEPYSAPGPSLFAVIAPGRTRSAIVRAFVEFVRSTLSSG